MNCTTVTSLPGTEQRASLLQPKKVIPTASVHSMLGMKSRKIGTNRYNLTKPVIPGTPCCSEAFRGDRISYFDIKPTDEAKIFAYLVGLRRFQIDYCMKLREKYEK